MASFGDDVRSLICLAKNAIQYCAPPADVRDLTGRLCRRKVISQKRCGKYPPRKFWRSCEIA